MGFRQQNQEGQPLQAVTDSTDEFTIQKLKAGEFYIKDANGNFKKVEVTIAGFLKIIG